MKISTKQIQITFFTIAGVGLALLISECVVLERKNERWHQENQHMEAEVKKYIDSRIEEKLHSSTLEQRGGN
ncbi:MAG: hypothetical protein IJB00_08715 [Akkermansia sp.]|nr:hypothetical protein [Akkermansia sp.]